jgi:hypothetical protein
MFKRSFWPNQLGSTQSTTKVLPQTSGLSESPLPLSEDIYILYIRTSCFEHNLLLIAATWIIYPLPCSWSRFIQQLIQSILLGVGYILLIQASQVLNIVLFSSWYRRGCVPFNKNVIVFANNYICSVFICTWNRNSLYLIRLWAGIGCIILTMIKYSWKYYHSVCNFLAGN